MKKIALYTLLIAFCLIANLQSAKAQRPGARARASKINLSPAESINENLQRLPSGFRGHSIKAISEIAYKQIQKKGEYETTEQYNARAEAVKKQVTGKVYGFQTVHWEDGFSVQQYDADSETLTIRIRSRHESFREGASINIENFYTVERSIGSNAFGVRVPIKTYYGSEFFISYSNRIETEVSIQIAPALAQRVKPNLGVLFLCKLKANKEGKYLTGGPSFIEATIDSPIAKNVTRGYLSVDLISIWVFNKATGEILKKQVMVAEDEKK